MMVFSKGPRAPRGLARTCAGLLAMGALVAPVGASLAGTADLTVQYQNYNATGPNDDIIEAGLQLHNNTTAAIPLSGIVVRYWFTKNGAASATAACWWWSPDCANTTVTVGTVSATGADRYAEIRFGSGAGTLAAGATTQPIDLGITLGTAVSEADDYSYANQTTFANWSHITVHDAGSAPTVGLRGGTPPTLSSTGGGGGGTVTTEYFDDFSYTGNTDTNFTSRWSLRTNAGAPGVSGAQWKSANVSLVTDPALASNRLMRLQATTNGSGAGTSQVEAISTARKFQSGTYAARMRFYNTPLSGTRFLNDKPVETFFTITPYVEHDVNYSEQDFEYMPNGGWGQGNTSTMWLTSWESTDDKVSDSVSASHDGWNTLVIQISSTGLTYFINGVQRASHAAKFTPETAQYLDFQLWFDQLDTTQGSSRTYYEDADWVYFAKDALLSPNDIDARVAGFRSASVTRKDTLP